MLNYVCTNQKRLFKDNLRLFPPGFTKTEEFEDDAIEKLDEIASDIEHKQNELEKRKVEV